MYSRQQNLMTLTPIRPGRHSPFMEVIEPRKFLAVTMYTNSEISDPSGDYYAAVLMGDNGNPSGIATASAGIGDVQEVWEFPEWDSNLDDGLDSSWQSMSFSLNNNDDDMATWQVGSEAADTFAIGPDPVIESVTIRACVSNSFCAMDFKNLTVKFYNGTTLMQTINVRNFGASTMISGTELERGAIVTGNASSYTGVVVTGQFRLQAAQGTYPGPSDIFGHILIN